MTQPFCSRKNSGRGRRLAAVVAVACVGFATACEGRSRTFFAAYGEAASTELELNVDSCNENPSAEVQESATEVRVRVVSDRPLGRNGGDCADGVTVTLKAPLGSRRLVDDTTGDVVEVQPPD